MKSDTITIAQREDDLLTRLTLLIGQSFFLGLTSGLLVISAIALLLSFYGATALPYTYIAVAVIGAVAFYGFAELQRRYTLVEVSIVTELIIASFVAFAWAGLVFLQANWLAFAATVAIPLVIQVGFVILGGQAGRLLDVRQIKRYFSRIVAGFVVGFLIAGAVTPALQLLLGGTAYLLLVSALTAGVGLIILLITNGRYRVILAQSAGSGPDINAPPLRKVLAKRFVLLIFIYMMLSAIVSQLLDFIVMSSAGARFTESGTLATFLGDYTVVLNLVNLIFLTLISGLLLSRFGLRFGLSAKPGVDILLLIAIVATGLIAGPQTSSFFWLVVITRILDITFYDGTTRSSVNATFQALPAHERVTVQTGVEGIGVPLALGLTGLVLLLFDALPNITLVHVGAFSLLVSLLWIVCALLVYKRYGANLLKTMRRRALDPVNLTLEDDASLAVIQRLISSEKLSDVRLALDMLQGAEHPILAEELINLAHSGPSEIQREALQRIENLKLQSALPVVQSLSVSPADPRLQGAAIRALCALQEENAVELVISYLQSNEEEVRVGTAVGLLRYGSIPGILAVGDLLKKWELSSDLSDRCMLARIIGDVAQPHVYQPLIPLLTDPELTVRRAALAAAGRIKHPQLLPLIIANLSDRLTWSVASETLVAYGDLILPTVARALSGKDFSEAQIVCLVRICRQIKGPQVLALLRRNLDYSSNAVRDQILAALSACDFHAQTADLPALNKALVRDVSQGQQLLVTLGDIGHSEAVSALQRALHDELTLANKRIFWLLSFIYEAQPILRAAARLQRGSQSEQAFALELLDVTLSAEHKTLAMPLLNPALTQEQRIQLLNKRVPSPALGRDERLKKLLYDSTSAWIRACALYAIGLLASVAQIDRTAMTSLIEEALADADPVVRETAAWSLSKTAPQLFSHHQDALLADADPHVSRVTASLITT